MITLAAMSKVLGRRRWCGAVLTDRSGRFSVWVGYRIGSTLCLDVGLKEGVSRKCPGVLSGSAMF